MLASANEDYVFKIIDSPLIPEEKSKPSRALICIFGTILGAFINLIIILQRFKDDILNIFINRNFNYEIINIGGAGYIDHNVLYAQESNNEGFR